MNVETTPRWVIKARSTAPERQIQTPVVIVVGVVVCVVFVSVRVAEDEEDKDEGEVEAVETCTSWPCATSAILLRIKEPKKSSPKAVCKTMLGCEFEDERRGKRRSRLASWRTELQAEPPGVKTIGVSVSASVPHSGRWLTPPTTTSQKASPTIEIWWRLSVLLLPVFDLLCLRNAAARATTTPTAATDAALCCDIGMICR